MLIYNSTMKETKILLVKNTRKSNSLHLTVFSLYYYSTHTLKLYHLAKCRKVVNLVHNFIFRPIIFMKLNRQQGNEYKDLKDFLPFLQRQYSCMNSIVKFHIIRVPTSIKKILSICILQFFYHIQMSQWGDPKKYNKDNIRY